MSSQQSPGLLAQFFESFFGISWRSEGPDEAGGEPAPLCSACQNTVKRTAEGQWRCPHHPNASFIEQARPDQG